MARKRPTRIRVEVTLRGMRAAGDRAPTALQGAVFPWLHAAGFMRTLARLVDEEGRPLTVDGHRILARFANEEECLTACRMTKRKLRRHWQTRTLDLPMRFEPPRRRDYIFIALFLSAWVAALLAAGMPMLTAPLGSGPVSLQFIGFSLVLLWLVGFPAVMISVMVWLVIQQSSPVSALRITHDRIEFTIPGREPQRQAWRNLRDRRGSVLRFTDGARVRLPTRDTRLRALLPLLDADILGIPLAPARLVTPWMFVRLVIVGLLLGAGALCIFHWLIVQGYIPGPLPTGRILLAAVMGPAFLALAMLEACGMRGLARWINRHTRGMRKRKPPPLAPHAPDRSHP